MLSTFFPDREWNETTGLPHPAVALGRSRRQTREPINLLDAAILQIMARAPKITYVAIGKRCVPPADGKEVWRLATGDEGRKIDLDWAQRLSPAVDVAPLDLLEDRRRRVPLEWRIAAEFSEENSGPLQLCGADREWFESTQRAMDQCFAARIEDDSATGFGWPRGTLLFLRRIAHAELHATDVVLVKAPTWTGFQVIVGRLGWNNIGDLVVATHSLSPHVDSSVTIRRAAQPRIGLAEAPAMFRSNRQAQISYSPQDGDLAEILGKVEAPPPRH